MSETFALLKLMQIQGKTNDLITSKPCGIYRAADAMFEIHLLHLRCAQGASNGPVRKQSILDVACIEN